MRGNVVEKPKTLATKVELLSTDNDSVNKSFSAAFSGDVVCTCMFV